MPEVDPPLGPQFFEILQGVVLTKFLYRSLNILQTINSLIDLIFLNTTLFCFEEALRSYLRAFLLQAYNPIHTNNDISIWNELSSHHPDIPVASASGNKLVRLWDLQVFSKLVESAHCDVKINKNNPNN